MSDKLRRPILQMLTFQKRYSEWISNSVGPGTMRDVHAAHSTMGLNVADFHTSMAHGDTSSQRIETSSANSIAHATADTPSNVQNRQADTEAGQERRAHNNTADAVFSAGAGTTPDLHPIEDALKNLGSHQMKQLFWNVSFCGTSELGPEFHKYVFQLIMLVAALAGAHFILWRAVFNILPAAFTAAVIILTLCVTYDTLGL